MDACGISSFPFANLPGMSILQHIGQAQYTTEYPFYSAWVAAFYVPVFKIVGVNNVIIEGEAGAIIRAHIHFLGRRIRFAEK